VCQSCQNLDGGLKFNHSSILEYLFEKHKAPPA
jgi:hypothetical protein